MNRILLITGGARSGKSRYALDVARRYNRRAFIAAAEPFDAEMRARIEQHRLERGGDFFTIEEPLDLAQALRALPQDTEVVVVDCLTVWLGNLFHRRGPRDSYPETEAFLKTLARPPCSLILVTNEVGWSLVPGDEVSRRFRDAAGRLNQAAAAAADAVALLVCGVPTAVKGSLP